MQLGGGLIRQPAPHFVQSAPDISARSKLRRARVKITRGAAHIDQAAQVSAAQCTTLGVRADFYSVAALKTGHCKHDGLLPSGYLGCCYEDFND
jgi:hypothetical protein